MKYVCMSGGLSKFLLSTVSKILPKSVMFKRDDRGLLPELREFKIIAGGSCIIQKISDFVRGEGKQSHENRIEKRRK